MQSYDMSQSVLEAVFDLLLLYVSIVLLFGYCVSFHLVWYQDTLFMLSVIVVVGLLVPGTFLFPLSEYNI